MKGMIYEAVEKLRYHLWYWRTAIRNDWTELRKRVERQREWLDAKQKFQGNVQRSTVHAPSSRTSEVCKAGEVDARNISREIGESKSSNGWLQVLRHQRRGIQQVVGYIPRGYSCEGNEVVTSYSATEADRLKARERMRVLRGERGSTPSDRARNKAIKELIRGHREEFQRTYRNFLKGESEDELRAGDSDAGTTEAATSVLPKAGSSDGTTSQVGSSEYWDMEDLDRQGTNSAGNAKVRYDHPR